MTDPSHPVAPASPAAEALATWLSRIEAMHPADIELGLGRLLEVAARLQVASLAMPVITVAGTNGKGSTLRLMTALAEQLGLKVCLYTSPHILHFNERVRLPDGLASDAQLCAAFDQVELARQGHGDEPPVPLTYFEFTTLAALWLFRDSGADLVLLEVGLGGRLDAVNIVDPDVSVVTSVGLDHQDWLGDTREAICAEKCGIARCGTPLVFGEQDWPANLTDCVAQYGAEGVLAGRDFGPHEGLLRLCDGQRIPLPTEVTLGRDNLCTAVQAMTLAGFSLQAHQIAAVAGVTLMGRCEYRRIQGADWWFDVGHNLPAVQRFHDLLADCPGRRHLVFGMMADKPREAVAGVFAEDARAIWYLAAPAIARSASTAALRAVLPADAVAAEYACVADAVHEALSAAIPGDQVVVFGSFHTVAEAWQAVEE